MLALKTVHVAAAVLWLGNFAVTGVWALRAALQRSAALFAFATREILFTDAIFTLVFGSAVVISGFALARAEGIDTLHVFWTRTALAIVLACGVAWLSILLPLELWMHRRARAGLRSRKAFVAWNAVGWLLTAALFSIIYLMVAKPV